MTVREKIDLIDSLEEIECLNEEHFKLLERLAFDDDAFVRSRCAALLINFETEKSMKLLLRLAIRQYLFAFFPCSRQNCARKST